MLLCIMLVFSILFSALLNADCICILYAECSVDRCNIAVTKTVELAPSRFDVKSFPRQSRFRGGGIAMIYKSTLGSNITFKTNFDFTHTSFEVVQASITMQHMAAC